MSEIEEVIKQGSIDLRNILVLSQPDFVFQLNLLLRRIIVALETEKKNSVKLKVQDKNGNQLGGFLTNWSQVNKSLKKMLKIEEDQEKGEYKLYTKYEQAQIDKERSRLERFFGGLRQLKQIPDAIFVIDPKREENVIDEANQVGVELLALADSDADADKLNLLVPANDDAIATLEFMIAEVIKAYSEGKKKIKS